MDAASLAAIFDVLPDPALVVQAEGGARRVIMANAAAREIFHLGDGIPMLPSVIRRPEALDLVEASLFAGQSGEVSWDTGSAQDRRLTAISRPLPPLDALPLALLIVRDETDALRNERMSADFLANASHELKTPLASLTGFIETLRGHAKDDPVARERFLGVMADQAERMGRLVTDLMSLSRIELNEHIPPSGEVDLIACAKDVADAMTPIADAAKVLIKIAGSGPATVVGDRHQLFQVIQNLVENAIKYAGPGTAVTVEVARDRAETEIGHPKTKGAASRTLLSPDTSPGAHFVGVRVADKGVGMPREQLPRLTERFYRAPGQGAGTPGTGLGLAIVKHIVNRHRGGLFVESTPGKGSAFTAYFPQM